MIAKRRTYHKEIIAEVTSRLIKKTGGTMWTAEMWDIQYDICWAEHAIETIELKKTWGLI